MILFGIKLLPTQASTAALPVDLVYLFIVAVTIFFTALIYFLVMFFAVKYRRRSDSERPKPIEGNHLLEIIWIGVPTLIVLVMFAAGAIVYFYIFHPPKDGIQMYGVGKQWMWKFQHPDGRREINDLHVPTGTPVKLTLTSEDVIHSFYVPAFRVKMDVVPGRYNQTWFEATVPGEYHLFCAEYCGTEHSRMIGKVIVMKPDDYAQWLSGQDPAAGAPTESMAARGAKIFQDMRCATCHAPGTTAGLGPKLEKIYGKTIELEGGQTVKVDDGYLRESILLPTKRIVKGYQPLMPTYQGQISEEDVLAVVAYIKSLTPADEAETAPAKVPAVELTEAATADKAQGI
ncbi:MAG: cytochrome c oxidase subunit II [Candidatus Omnitrophica bacterium]|jgi:cytochrome c oxidase subunit 2|nr:cytochrome c oxidase subunit II [Candidatus Omnitrophota bacterium]